MFGKEPENTTINAGQTSIIAQGCKFEGSISVKGTLRIEGEFKGEIGTPESLVVGKTGVVNASDRSPATGTATVWPIPIKSIR